MDDSKIEVIALDNLDMALLRLGGSGCCITQCKNAVIRTKKAIPMQVDGEPCLLKPATIQIGLDSSSAGQAKMLKRDKKATCEFKDCIFG